MKHLTIILCLLLFMATGILAQPVRTKINLNREWRFTLSDPLNAEQVSFSDQNWEKINLPHSFSMLYFLWSCVYNGYGWYRKEIDIPVEWKGKQVQIEFEGVFPSSSCYPPDPKDQDAFDESVLQQLKELIRINRNSPSITAWSMSNEPFFTDASTDDRMKVLLNRATDSTHVWDASRLVAIGGCQRKGIDKPGKNQVVFYNGDGADFPAPGVPNMVSEYSSVSTFRPGKFDPGWGT